MAFCGQSETKINLAAASLHYQLALLVVISEATQRGPHRHDIFRLDDSQWPIVQHLEQKSKTKDDSILKSISSCPAASDLALLTAAKCRTYESVCSR